MYRYFIMLIFFLTAVTGNFAAAKTYTDGTIDVTKISQHLQSELNDFVSYKKAMLGKIDHNKDRIHMLKQRYLNAGKSEQMVIKSRLLKENAQYLKYYHSLYNKTVSKTRQILSKVKTLRKGIRSSKNMLINSKLKDPVIVKKINNLYGTLSTLALNCKDPDKQKVVAQMLKNTDQLYKQNTKGALAAAKIMQNMDGLLDSLENTYVKAKVGMKKLDLKEKSASYAVELYKYIMAVRPVYETVSRLKVIDTDLPEIDLSEDILNLTQEVELGPDRQNQNNNSLDTLKEYKSTGPKFLQ